MPNRRPLLLTCIVAVVVTTGAWIFWRPSQSETRQQEFAPPPSNSKETTNSSVASPVPPPEAGTAGLIREVEPSQIVAPRTAAEILADPALDNLSAANALRSLVQDSTVKLEERAEALAHLLNLSVENETTLLLPLIQSPRLPEAFATTILNDSLNRPLKWQADVCLAIMTKQTGKALQTEAREHLAFLTDEDHGDDLKAWIIAARKAQTKWQETEQ